MGVEVGSLLRILRTLAAPPCVTHINIGKYSARLQPASLHAPSGSPAAACIMAFSPTSSFATARVFACP